MRILNRMHVSEPFSLFFNCLQYILFAANTWRNHDKTRQMFVRYSSVTRQMFVRYSSGVRQVFVRSSSGIHHVFFRGSSSVCLVSCRTLGYQADCKSVRVIVHQKQGNAYIKSYNKSGFVVDLYMNVIYKSILKWFLNDFKNTIFKKKNDWCLDEIVRNL